MKEFMLIFRRGIQPGEPITKMSPEEINNDIQRWSSWMGELAKKGKLVGGQPLYQRGKVIRTTSHSITDGPFTEGKDIVGGYLLVKAADFNEAITLSRGCPTLELIDGSVEVREIMPMG